MYKNWLNDMTRQISDVSSGNDAKSAQIGFYNDHLDPIGAFGALLYQTSAAEPHQLLHDLETFLDVEKAKLCSSLGKSAARLVWYLLQECFYDNIGIHQSLTADLDCFYKISLKDGGRLEAFEIPFALETSIHPQKGIILWEQKERNPNVWAGEGQPQGWQLIKSTPLNLPISLEK